MVLIRNDTTIPRGIITLIDISVLLAFKKIFIIGTIIKTYTCMFDKFFKTFCFIM